MKTKKKRKQKRNETVGPQTWICVCVCVYKTKVAIKKSHWSATRQLEKQANKLSARAKQKTNDDEMKEAKHEWASECSNAL